MRKRARIIKYDTYSPTRAYHALNCYHTLWGILPTTPSIVAYADSRSVAVPFASVATMLEAMLEVAIGSVCGLRVVCASVGLLACQCHLHARVWYGHPQLVSCTPRLLLPLAC
jgi:hypothetical protein